MARLDIANGGSFDVYVWSEGDGSPLVYLHGFEHHPGGAPFLRRLAERHRVVAPELPGYGTSTGFEHLHGVTGVALFLRELLGSLGVEQADVVGHSLGGMFAAELAALCPSLVRRLVLVDAFGVWVDGVPAQDPYGQAELVEAALWASGKRPADEPSNFVPDPGDPMLAAVTRTRNLATATAYLWPIPDRGLRHRLPYVHAPTLVVQGARDGVVPVAHAEELARLIPNATLAVIDGAGHYPMIEQEDRFVDAVTAFLAPAKETTA